MTSDAFTDLYASVREATGRDVELYEQEVAEAARDESTRCPWRLVDGPRCERMAGHFGWCRAGARLFCIWNGATDDD